MAHPDRQALQINIITESISYNQGVFECWLSAYSIHIYAFESYNHL